MSKKTWECNICEGDRRCLTAKSIQEYYNEMIKNTKPGTGEQQKWLNEYHRQLETHGREKKID